MYTVIETTTFTRQANKVLSATERHELIAVLADNPLVGKVLLGSGGVRKLRIPTAGRGKRGEARVIYYLRKNVRKEDGRIWEGIARGHKRSPGPCEG